MSARTERGWKWFKFVMMLVLITFAIKIVFAVGNGSIDKVALAVMYLIAGTIMLALPAYFLGWVTGSNALDSSISDAAGRLQDRSPTQFVEIGQTSTHSSTRPVAVEQARIGPHSAARDVVAGQSAESRGQDPAATDASASQDLEYALYECIGSEIDSGQLDRGTWTRAFAESGGNEKQAQALYIRFRFERLHQAEVARLEQERKHREVERRQQEEERRRTMSVRELLANGYANGELEALEMKGGTQFHLACRWGTLDEISEFIDLNPLYLGVRDSDGNTCLHIAIREKREDVIELLLKSGASALQENRFGKTPLELVQANLPAASGAVAMLEQAAVQQRQLLGRLDR